MLLLLCPALTCMSFLLLCRMSQQCHTGGRCPKCNKQWRSKGGAGRALAGRSNALKAGQAKPKASKLHAPYSRQGSHSARIIAHIGDALRPHPSKPCHARPAAARKLSSGPTATDGQLAVNVAAQLPLLRGVRAFISPHQDQSKFSHHKS